MCDDDAFLEKRPPLPSRRESLHLRYCVTMTIYIFVPVISMLLITNGALGATANMCITAPEHELYIPAQMATCDFLITYKAF